MSETTQPAPIDRDRDVDTTTEPPAETAVQVKRVRSESSPSPYEVAERVYELFRRDLRRDRERHGPRR